MIILLDLAVILTAEAWDRRKLTEKIQRSGSRLVVVPEVGA